MKTTTTTPFLNGGGEMGELVRNFNWETTPIGNPERWPLSLKTMVGNLLHSAFPMLLFWGPDLICIYNDAMRPSLGMEGKHPAVGKSCKTIWEEAWDFIGPLLEGVVATGNPVWFEDQLVPFFRNGRVEDIYWTFSYSPAFGDDGEIAGVLVVCHETTNRVNALIALKAQKEELDFAIEAAELGTWELNPITNKLKGNARLKSWFGLDEDDEIELSRATDVISEKDRPRVFAAIAEALNFESGGRYEVEYTIRNPHTGKDRTVKAKGRAFFNKYQQPYHFSGTLQDVTADAGIRLRLAIEASEQLKAKQKWEESELFSREIFNNSPVAKLVFTGENMIIERINENMLTMLGRDHTIVGKPFFEALPELLNTPILDRLRQVFDTGRTYLQPEEKLVLIKNGRPYTGYYNYAYKALVSSAGRIYGIIVTATEVTDQVIARQQVEAKEKELRDLISASPIGICVLSGNPVWVEEVNDRFLLIAGKTRGQFEAAPYWEVMREIAPMFEDILANVLKTGIRYTSEEHEMVLIRSGVPEKIFSTFEYIPVHDADGNVTKVILMAIDVTYQIEVRRQIEEAVILRTQELAETNLSLKRSNAELEQFAYIASHDLQEPIRKISTFTSMLEHSLDNISQQSKGYIEKIYSSTDRVTRLIRDVLAFSRVANEMLNFEQVDLNKIWEAVRLDFEISIRDSQAVIHVSGLPTIEAMPTQMIQLFGNLLSNSIKYQQPGARPVISISAGISKDDKIAKRIVLDPRKKYYHIVFSDNGIGFADGQTDKIFRIFQRLHRKDEFEGTGIGLAICQRIVESHNGHIFAEAGENGGAVFNILLPETNSR